MSATEASRRFSELLDLIEREGESVIVERHGKAIAVLGPAPISNGAAVIELLRKQRPDPDWARDISETLALLEPPKDYWPD
jgi:antitoxin (DNA-binding transcriptional repressor) of toxin-antitoxin stability system